MCQQHEQTRASQQAFVAPSQAQKGMTVMVVTLPRCMSATILAIVAPMMCSHSQDMHMYS